MHETIIYQYTLVEQIPISCLLSFNLGIHMKQVTEQRIGESLQPGD